MDSVVNLPLVNNEAAQHSTTALITKAEPFTEFTLFPKLPVEIRLLIWGFATFKPAVVVQRVSSVKGRRFFFDRPVPAILQVNREALNEYIELEPDKKDKTLRAAQLLSLERRRREHPLYKLCFRNRSKMSAGAYFSAAVDSFFGMNYGTVKPQPDRATRWTPYLGITELNIAATLKHLILVQTVPELKGQDFIIFSKSFPCLETLTLLIPDYCW